MALSGNTLDIYNEARMPALNPGETRVIGKLGGLAVQIRRQLFDGRQPGVELPGQTLHEAELSDNPLGVISSLENQLRRMEERLDRTMQNEVELKERSERMSWSGKNQTVLLLALSCREERQSFSPLATVATDDTMA